MNTTETNRINAYNDVKVSKKRLENCLLPLWELGESTQQEIADFIKVPINELNGRFNESLKNGLIQIHPVRPSKLNSRTLKQNTNYILSNVGKEIVKGMMGVKQPSAMGKQIFSAVSSVFL